MVDGCQKVLGFLAFPLLVPESADAHSRTQFPRFRLLTLGYTDGVLKTSFRFSGILRRALQQECALEAVEFSFAPAGSHFVRKRQGFGEQREPCLWLSHDPIGFCEECQKSRPSTLRSCGTIRL